MTHRANPFVYIPGAGGGTPDLSLLLSEPDGVVAFEPVKYPGWRRCADPQCSGDMLVSDLATEIEARIPAGPISIVGLSLGGHFAYLVANQLQMKGRQVQTVCAIDAFIVNTTLPTPGWQQRALFEFLELVRGLRFAELSRFLRSRLWRGLLRAAGGRLPYFLNKVSRFKQLSRVFEIDPILKQEIDMRMLIHVVIPWLATIDVNPVRLSAPLALLRTEATASSDGAWRARCPNLAIFEIEGLHHTLFDAENIGSLRNAFLAAVRNHSTSSE